MLRGRCRGAELIRFSRNRCRRGRDIEYIGSYRNDNVIFVEDDSSAISKIDVRLVNTHVRGNDGIERNI